MFYERALVVDTFHVGNSTWTVRRYRLSEIDETESVRIFENGRLRLRKDAEGELGAIILNWPYRGKLLAVSQHSGAGHGMSTWLYWVRQDRVIDLRTTIESEAGGPEFRDLDHDGRPEILFDNYNWYEHWDNPPSPTKILAYKFDGKSLRLWRMLPNKKHRRLSQRFYFLRPLRGYPTRA